MSRIVHSFRYLFAIAAAGLMTLAVFAVPAQAQSADTPFASFQGRTVDLRKGWETATVCAVFSRTEVRCYASIPEADYDLAVTQAVPNSDPADITPMATWHGCPDNWVCIYEHINWGGRMLRFSDEYWHALSAWGFEYQTSSWTNNQNNGGCADTGILGNGSGDNRTLYDCSASASLGTYNDKAKDIYG